MLEVRALTMELPPLGPRIVVGKIGNLALFHRHLLTLIIQNYTTIYT